MSENNENFLYKLMKENLSSAEKCIKINEFRFKFPEDSIIDFEKLFYCYFD